jgi:hypothetical protein
MVKTRLKTFKFLILIITLNNDYFFQNKKLNQIFYHEKKRICSNPNINCV